MDALQMTLLFDYYGDLLTERQRMCIDMRYNQDMSLGEIAQELQVSRQGVYDNLNRAEALLTNMEQKTGCVRRDLQCRKVLQTIEEAAKVLENHQDSQVRQIAAKILSAAQGLEVGGGLRRKHWTKRELAEQENAKVLLTVLGALRQTGRKPLALKCEKGLRGATCLCPLGNTFPVTKCNIHPCPHSPVTAATELFKPKTPQRF